VASDPAGDANYANNTLTQQVATADWHFTVVGPGSADTAGNSLVITIVSTGPWSNSATLVGSVDGGGTTTLSFTPTIAGAAVGSNLAITLPPGNTTLSGFPATVSTSNSATQTGLYPAQVIVQLMDNGIVTARRQATIHVQVNNASTLFNYPVNVSCTYNGVSCNSGNGIQVNGPLRESYFVTIVPTCPPGVACTGAADVLVTDGPNSSSTLASGAPPAFPGLAFNTPLEFDVAGEVDAGGNVNPGPVNGYAVSLSSVQRNLKRGSTAPDPVGVIAPITVTVGDLRISANTGANLCTPITSSGSPVPLNITWNVLSGFNAPIVTWDWEDANKSPVGFTPLSFSPPSGSSTFSGGSYSPQPSFTLTNTHPQDGLAAYYFHIRIMSTSGSRSADNWFGPFYFDLSSYQNFCGAAGRARGYTQIPGSWRAPVVRARRHCWRAAWSPAEWICT
jgi:hypothetical protein